MAAGARHRISGLSRVGLFFGVSLALLVASAAGESSPPVGSTSAPCDAVDREAPSSPAAPPTPGHDLDPKDLKVALSIQAGGVSVYSGTGKRLAVWERQALAEDSKSRRSVSYYAPDMHPEQDRFLCIKCLERLDKREGRGFDMPVELDCELREVSFEDRRESKLVSLAPGEEVASPVYSPEGERIAWVRGSSVEVYEPGARRVTHSFPRIFIDQPTKHPLLSQLMAAEGHARLVRWAADGRSLFVLGPRAKPNDELTEPLSELMSPPTGVATVDLPSGRACWLNLYSPWFRAGKRMGQYFEVRGGEWVSVQGELPDGGAVAGLFGSAKNPVLGAAFSSGRRFFFYVLEEEGWFWKSAIMRYDTSTGKLTSIRTLERGLYRE